MRRRMNGGILPRLPATAAGVFLVAMAIAWSLPSAGTAAVINVNVIDDQFDPAKASFEVLPFPGSHNVEWQWDTFGDGITNNEHNVKSNAKLFKSGKPTDDGGTYELNASAGKFPYHCKVHGDEGMRGKIKISPVAFDHTVRRAARGEQSALVHWASDETETGSRFDVQYRVDGRRWKDWKPNTEKFKARFGKNGKPRVVDWADHDYEVRARSEKGKQRLRKRSRWSPPRMIDPP